MMLRVGIVGGSFAGTLHAEGWIKTGRAQIVAVASPTKSTQESFHAKFACKTYSSAAEMIENEELDVISLTLPNVYHYELSLLAMSKGIHVVCEKPLAMNLEQAAEMVAASKQSNVQLFYAEQLVFAPRYQKIKELVTENTFGPLVHISHRERHGGPHAKWFRDPAMSGGGVTMDMGIHGIGLIQWLLKPAKVTHVYARILTIDKSSQVDDHCLMTLEFDNGVLATVDASWVSPGGVDDVLEILGRDGYVRADLARGQTMDVYSLNNAGYSAEKVEVNKGWLKISHEEARTWGWYAEIEHFTSVILDGTQSEMSGEEGLQALKVALAAYESSKTNQRIEIK